MMDINAMTRASDWPQRLSHYIIDAQARYAESGHLWGEFDCVTFVCDWVLLARGDDPMAGYRGRYSSWQDAARLLRENGPGTLEAALEAAFGPPVAAASGMRGDIAFRKEEKSCGIFVTQGARMRAIFLGEDGFMQASPAAVDLAFRV